MLLVMEVANVLIAYLAGATLNNDLLEFRYNENQFTAKRKSIIAYISGYVFGTMYRRIRFSKSSQEMISIYHQQCLSFLMAEKCKDENQILPEHAHVNIFYRSDLWKVNKNVVAILSVEEAFSLSLTKNQSNNVDIIPIFFAPLTDSYVPIHFSKLRDDSPDSIKKEIAFNLLEDLLTLYLRVRVFSFVKNKAQICKIQKSKTKSRSFRRGPLNCTNKTAVFIATFKNSYFYSYTYQKSIICYFSYFLKSLVITYRCVCIEFSFMQTFGSPPPSLHPTLSPSSKTKVFL